MIKKVTERSSAFVVLSRKTLIIGMIGIAVISFALGYFFGYGAPSSEKLVKHVEAVSKAAPSEEKAVSDSAGKPAEGPAVATKKPEAAQLPKNGAEDVKKEVPAVEKKAGPDTPRPAVAEKQKEQGQPRIEYQEKISDKPKKKSRQKTGKKRLSKRSYAVQVGSFLDPPKARLLKEELDSKGYNSYIMSYAPDKGKTFSRVRIGPYATRKLAAALIPELKKQGFDGVIVPGRR
jgi:cell division septation protein DedD